ncbi:MAG TPA: hypothetical protein ENI87_07980 [bacterium]|nr:hypothetical protein [bacterium]
MKEAERNVLLADVARGEVAGRDGQPLGTRRDLIAEHLRHGLDEGAELLQEHALAVERGELALDGAEECGIDCWPVPS